MGFKFGKMGKMMDVAWNGVKGRSEYHDIVEHKKKLPNNGCFRITSANIWII
jgi:hypothetical protein